MVAIVVTAVIAVAVGLVAGFFIGVYWVRKQLEQMQSDPKKLQEMARQMGISLNQQQLNKARKMLKNSKFR
jgi:hypothetical protein